MNSYSRKSRKVLVRDNMAGVFFGTLVKSNGKSCIIRDARKIHYWTKAAAVEGIAATGIVGKGSRITPKVKVVSMFDVVEIIDIEDAAYKILESHEEWKP